MVSRQAIVSITATLLALSDLRAQTTLTVSTPGDAAFATGGTFSVNSGDLRGVLNYINQNPGSYDVVFALGSSTIMPLATLPVVNFNAPNAVTIDGGNQITLDGTLSNSRGLFVSKGTVSIENMTIQNMVAKGGAGGSGAGGGGGLGAGAAIFVDQATVTVSNLNFMTNQANGGNGAATVGTAGGGGGGMGGNGGSGTAGGGGGGGLVGHGGLGDASGGGGGAGGIGNGGDAGTGQGGAGGGGGAIGCDGGTSSLVPQPGTGLAGLGGGGGGGGNLTNNGASGGGGGAAGGMTVVTLGGGGGGGGGSGASPGADGSSSNLGTAGNGGTGGIDGGGGGGGYGKTHPGFGGNGGANGGGGGGGGHHDGIFFTSGGLGGTGSYGGGGGGGNAGGNGGSGGFGGGGGGGGRLAAILNTGGAKGGFGGGGGGGPKAGNGGFGGGGGAAANGPFINGKGGEGAGNGLVGVGGGGGAGLGGAVFVNAGGRLIVQSPISLNNNTTSPGTGAFQGAAAGDDFFIVTGSSLIFSPNQNQSITINKPIADDSSTSLPTGNTYQPGTGAGASVTKQGLGTLIVNSANTYAGETLVEEGLLILNGSVADSALVTPGGILTGTGTVSRNLVNVGTVIPGNTVGTLNVGGNYTQTSGILIINIVNPTSLGFINTNTANLDGTLQVVGLSNFTPQLGQAITFLTATGGVSGTFSNVSRVNLSLTPYVKYLPNSVEIVFGPSLSSFPAAWHETIFTSVNQNNIRLERQMEKLRGRFTKRESSSQNVAYLFPEEQLLASLDNPEIQEKQEHLRRTLAAPKQEKRGSFYLGPIGSVGELFSKQKMEGYDYSSVGALTGFDYAFSQVGFGLLASYEKIDADVKHHWGNFAIQQAHASLYATCVPKHLPELAFNGIAGSGLEWYEIHRNVDFPERKTTKGFPHGEEFDALFGMEYAFSHQQFTFIPLASIQYIILHIDMYKERGIGLFNLETKRQNARSLRSTLGARMNYIWREATFTFIPEIDIAWQREFFDKDRDVRVTPVSAPGIIFSTPIIGVGRNIALAGVDLLFTLYETYGIEASYDFEWNTLFHDHAFYVGFNILY